MAILKSVVQVNNGNTGWTKTNVLNALEQTFSNLGFNDGSQVNGVACTTLPPGSTSSYNNGGYNNSNWRYCGGFATESYVTSVTKNYQVTTSGTSYSMREYFAPSYISTNDQFVISRHGLSTGDPIVWSGNTSINTSTGTLTNNTTYYAIVVDLNNIKLATSSGNASSGTAIDITNNYNAPDGRLTKPNYVLNPSITVYQSDTINFELNVTGQPFYVSDTAGAYNANRVLNATNYNTISYRTQPSGQGNISGNLSWNTTSWKQGNYYYVSQNTSTMTGTITVLPNSYNYTNSFTLFPYWDYTIPSSGPRSSLTVRVYRFPRSHSYPGYVAGVEILSTTSSGWSNDEVFTIPGNQIGGAATTNDIVFGVNSSSTPSIKVTNLGAGVNFYQKFTNQSKAILKVINNPSKTYGTTYYGFAFSPYNDYTIKITSGTSWQHLNYDPNSSEASNSGRWGGTDGMEFSSTLNRNLDYANMSYVPELNFCSSTTPTAYPLKIVTYKAQSPQDTNFALVQFVHTINGIDTAYLTFFIHRGTNFGNGVWDLDNVFQGCYTQIFDAGSEGIGFSTRLPTLYSSSEYPGDYNAIRRESFYGYVRDGSSADDGSIGWVIRNNLYNNNTNDYGGYYSNKYAGEALAYYRNSSYDRVTFSNTSTENNKNDFQTLYSVSSNANYYKPIKGLPLSITLAPIPYYLPDDFTAIQFAVTPGATAFRPGDTITVSPSEIYEIVVVSYTTNQTTYDGVSQNTSKGIAFCARTT